MKHTLIAGGLLLGIVGGALLCLAHHTAVGGPAALLFAVLLFWSVLPD